MEKQKIIPALRFPEFSGEWEPKNLGAISDIIMGQSPDGESYNTISEGVALINGPVEFSDKYPVKVKWTTKPTKYCQNKDILFCVRGSTTGKMNIANDIYCIGRGVAAIRANQKCTTEFIELLLIRNLTEILILTTGSTFFNIDSKTLKEFIFSIPTLPEQTKIASFLTVVDERLNQLKQKKSLLEQYKKGVMQKIFDQEIRFKDDDGSEFPEIVVKKLGVISKITTGKLDANAMIENGKYRFYTCAKTYYKIDNYAFDTEALLVSGNGANVGYIHYYKGKFNAYQRTYVLDGFEENIIYAKYFLEQFLSSRIDVEKKEGNTPYIVLSTLSEMNINLPCPVEQTKIANFLSAIDEKISLCNTQITKTEQYKKGLLQQMFV